jgi:hypothetical protein
VCYGTNGTKIGTATTQTISLWNATPIVQPSGSGQATLTNSSLTDSTGGTVSTTLAAITAGTSYSQTDMQRVKNALASLCSQINAMATLELAIRTALVNIGAIKGSA